MKLLRNKRYDLSFWRSYPGFSFKKYKADMYEIREWKLCLGYFVLRKMIHPAIIASWPPWTCTAQQAAEALRILASIPTVTYPPVEVKNAKD